MPFLSVWPLGGHLHWPLTSWERSKFKVYFFAPCISKHRFFGMENSKMTSDFHFDLSEVIYNDLWPLNRGQNSKYIFLHHVYQNIGFLGWETQKWHQIFILTPPRSSTMTFHQRSRFKIYFLCRHVYLNIGFFRHQVFFILTSQRSSTVSSDFLSDSLSLIGTYITFIMHIKTIATLTFNLSYVVRGH